MELGTNQQPRFRLPNVLRFFSSVIHHLDIFYALTKRGF